MRTAIRGAPPFDSYPTLRQMHEIDLIPVIRVEFCACGGYVRQFMGDDIPGVMRRHVATIEHRSWRYDQPSSDPTVDPDTVDMSDVSAARPVGGRRL